MAARLGRARDVACTLGIVDQEVDLLAARERFEADLRLRPAERAFDAAEIEPVAHDGTMPGARRPRKRRAFVARTRPAR
jgi:hypothetical protein